jgi:hypothetical protein
VGGEKWGGEGVRVEEGGEKGEGSSARKTDESRRHSRRG